MAIQAGPTGRVIAVLDRMAADPWRTFTLTELARDLGISKATLHAVVRNLTAAGYLVRSPTTPAYGLGPALVRLGGAAAGARALAIELATPPAIELSREFGECVVSAPIYGDIGVLVRAVSGALDFRAYRYQPPLAAPVGSVFMAWAPADEVDAWLAHLGRDDEAERRNTMLRVLESIRRRGYAIGLGTDPRDGIARALGHAVESSGRRLEMSDELASMLRELDDHHYMAADLSEAADHVLDNIAAPVRGGDGTVVLALTIKGFPRISVSAEFVKAAGERLQEETRRISRGLSAAANGPGRGPPPSWAGPTSTGFRTAQPDPPTESPAH